MRPAAATATDLSGRAAELQRRHNSTGIALIVGAGAGAQLNGTSTFVERH
jgi:hypothetical protein